MCLDISCGIELVYTPTHRRKRVCGLPLVEQWQKTKNSEVRRNRSLSEKKHCVLNKRRLIHRTKITSYSHNWYGHLICTWVNQKFCYILVVRGVKFDSCGWFCRGREGDETHWTVRYRARLILSVCDSLDLLLWR